MALARNMSTVIDRFLRDAKLRSYVDKRLVSGVKKYYEFIEDNQTYSSKGFKSQILNKMTTVKSQQRIVQIINSYESLSESKEKMQFVSYVMLIAIITQLKVEELDIMQSKSDLNEMGISTAFIAKLGNGSDMIDDMASDFNAYVKEVSKSDLRYLEVGLKRLLASEVDSVI